MLESSPIRAGLLGLAIVASLALVAATFGDVIVVSVRGGRELAADSGLDRHGLALLLLAVACAGLGVLAWQGMRIAATGLLLVGLAVILVMVFGDLPDLHTTGRLPGVTQDATTDPGAGFYLESLGGVLALLAGGGFLLTGGGVPLAAPERHT